MKGIFLIFFLAITIDNVNGQCITYFNKKICVTSVPSIDTSYKYRADPYGKKGFIEYYKKNDNEANQRFVKDIKQQCKKLKLDEWSYYVIIDSLSKQYFTLDKEKERQAFVWVMLSMSSIDIHLGYNKEKIELYSRTAVPLRSVSMPLMSKVIFYNLDKTEDNVIKDIKHFHYKFDSYKAHKLKISTKVPKFIKRQVDTFCRVYKLEYADTVYEIKTCINKNIALCYNNLPSIEVSNKFNTFEQSKIKGYNLEEQLKKIVKGKPKEEQISMLLKFMQDNFVEKDDTLYLGYERTNFIDQTILEDTVDCDDKTSLLAYLLAKVLKVKSYQVLYNINHVNVGIIGKYSFPTTTFTCSNHYKYTYTVLEPTWKGNKPGEMFYWIENYAKPISIKKFF